MMEMFIAGRLSLAISGRSGAGPAKVRSMAMAKRRKSDRDNRPEQSKQLAIGYTRVSTADQEAEGVSLASQKSKIEQYADLHGLELSTFHTDSITGKRLDKRDGLRAAMNEVTESGGVLIVYSLSRFARSTRDAIDLVEQLSKAGADLVSLTEKLDTTSAMGKFTFRLFASLAELEADQVSERTRAACNTNASKDSESVDISRLATRSTATGSRW
jgi:DNA invertase Pin-like site-specific DNA recombinase